MVVISLYNYNKYFNIYPWETMAMLWALGLASPPTFQYRWHWYFWSLWKKWLAPIPMVMMLGQEMLATSSVSGLVISWSG